MARSKLARVMPLACASGHNSATKAAKDWFASCACAGAQKIMSEIVSAAKRANMCVIPAGQDTYRMLYQRYQCSAVALQPAGDFEFQQHGSHDCRRGARHA